MKLRKLIFCVLALVLFSRHANALDPDKPFSQYARDVWEEGLPQSSVQTLTQTRDGYLWLGTVEGLVRFDGVRFTVFDQQNTPQIKHNDIWALLEDAQGGLWIGSNGGGVTRYSEGRFTSYTVQQGLCNDTVSSLALDTQGAVWVGTSGGLSRFSNGRWTSFTTKDGLLSNNISALEAAHDGALWIGSRGGGLARLRNGAFATFTTKDGLSSDQVRAIREDQNGSLWIGTNSGLNRFEDGKFTVFTTKNGLTSDIVVAIHIDKSGTAWFASFGGGMIRYRNGVFSTYTEKDGLADNSVRSVLEDREGSLWIGTFGHGLVRLRETKFTTYTRQAGLAHDNVRAIAEDHERNLWVATEGGGLSRLAHGVWTSFGLADGLPTTLLHGLFADPDGSLWIGTWGGGLVHYQNGKFTRLTTADGLTNNIVASVYRDRKGVLWAGTNGGGLCRLQDGVFTSFTTKNGLTNDLVLPILEDRTGTLWIGTRGGGLNRLSGGVLTSITTKQGLSNDNVWCLYEDADGALWIGTDHGLNRLKNGHLTVITSAQGLANNVVFGLVEDASGTFWMSCNRGVYTVSRNELNDLAESRIRSIHSRLYTGSEGVKECNGGQPAAFRSKDGHLWFATIRGLATIDPAHIAVNRLEPSVIMEDVLANQESVAGLLYSHKLPRFEPGVSKLEFHYTATSLLSPDEVRFKYKLEGFDGSWVDAGKQRAAYYTNVPPGRYRFRVIARNNDGIWNETGSSFSFYLEPHFYQTKPFYALILLVGAAAVAGGYRFRLRRHRVRERELVRLVQERTDSLQKEKENVEKALQELETIDHIVRGINREIELEPVLKSLSQQGHVLFPQAETTAFLLLDHVDNRFKPVAISGADPALLTGVSFSFEEAVERYTKSGAELETDLHIISNFTNIAGQDKLKGVPVPRSILSMTVRLDGGIEGFLVLGNLTREDAFESSDVNRLRRFREHAVSAIAKAKVLGELKTVGELAREASLAKSRFLANMSHELRTPLNAILGYSEMLQDEAQEIGQTEFLPDLKKIQAASKHLLSLINDILDLSKIEAGKMELHLETFDIPTLVQETTSTVKPLIEKNGNELRVYCPADLGKMRADHVKVRQILFNLLSNAAKFTTRGTVSFIADREESEKGQHIIFRVSDTGIGITPQQMSKLFQAFSQADASTQSKYGGTGLGLALSRHFCQMMKGELEVESEPGAGATFTVRLPATVQNLRMEQEEELAPSEAKSPGTPRDTAPQD